MTELMQLHLLTGMPDGDSGWKAECTFIRKTSILRVGYIYNKKKKKKKIIRLYYLAMDISVNNHTKLYIYADMLRSYPCTCTCVYGWSWKKKKKKKMAGNAMRNTPNVPVHLRARYRVNNTGLLLQYKNTTMHKSKRPAGIMLKVWEEYVLLFFYPIE